MKTLVAIVYDKEEPYLGKVSIINLIYVLIFNKFHKNNWTYVTIKPLFETFFYKGFNDFINERIEKIQFKFMNENELKRLYIEFSS